MNQNEKIKEIWSKSDFASETYFPLEEFQRLVGEVLAELSKDAEPSFRGYAALYEAENAQCPVCGFYCLGKGGEGCIDKPALVSAGKEVK